MKDDHTETSSAIGGSTAQSGAAFSRPDLKQYLANNRSKQPHFTNYLRKLWMKYGALRLSALTDTSRNEANVSLPAVYTALDTETPVFIGRETAGAATSVGVLVTPAGSYLHQRVAIESGRLQKFTSGHVRQVTALEMLEFAPRLVLIGPAGSGKSTFIQFVALCMAGEVLEIAEANLKALNGSLVTEIPEPWPHGVLLPICIELRMFVRSEHFPGQGIRGTADHLLAYISSTLLSGRDPDIAAYLRAEAGPSLLMLDGLDEVPEALKNCGRLREVITDLSERFPSCRILVTSRPYTYRDPIWRLDSAGFQEASLAELRESQVHEFILHWYRWLEEHGQVSPEVSASRAKDLVTQIKRWPYLSQLAANPLLLTMIVAVIEQSGGRLPMNRSELYEEAVGILLDRWNQYRGLGAPAVSDALGVGPQTILNKLSEIAFEIHREQGALSGTGQITYKQLSEGLEAASGRSRIAIGEIMDYLHQRSGILIADGPGTFRFPHRSLQEYLAACYLVKRSDYPEPIARLATTNPTVWRDVLLFAAWRSVGYRPDEVWQLIAELCPDPVPGHVTDRTEWRGPFLAGLVLAETDLGKLEIPRRHRNTLVRTYEWLTTCIERRILSVRERAEVGWILGRVGDPRPGVGLGEHGVPAVEWEKIPSGFFLRGSSEADKNAFANEIPQQKVELDTYWISKYPITVAQFRSYIQSADCPDTLQNTMLSRWQKRPESCIDNYPVVDVEWSEAVEFCRWLGGILGYEVRLPTEEEWEKAARGNDSRIYPWGNEFDSHRCNVMNIGSVCAVGLFPEGASPYGVMDMCGNVWEWCTDIWRADYGAPKGIGRFHVIRGGSYGTSAEVARCAYRGKEGPAQSPGQGFRVATSRNPEPNARV